MSKTTTLTASEQAALLRYASSLPVESDMRKVIVAAVKVAAAGTWGQRLNELKKEYMGEVVREAVGVIQNEGGTAVVLKRSFSNIVNGNSADGKLISLTLRWLDEKTIESFMTLGIDTRNVKQGKRIGKHVVLSMSPSQVAAESLYAHFQGLLP